MILGEVYQNHDPIVIVGHLRLCKNLKRQLEDLWCCISVGAKYMLSVNVGTAVLNRVTLRN